MPTGFLFISLILPLTYIYDSSRAILLGQNSIFSLKMEFLIILAAMVGFCIMGNYIFMTVERRCRMKGNLGTH
jgi:ABC-2 type transport system permease protein